jgi:hypothetical protein
MDLPVHHETGIAQQAPRRRAAWGLAVTSGRSFSMNVELSQSVHIMR